MAALKAIATALSLCVTLPAQADTIAEWRPFMLEASRRVALPLDWIERVMRVESGGHSRIEGHPIVSRAGAMGLMQLMPGTWEAMRGMLRLGRDAFDPHDNILAGALYLRLMYERFGYPGCFAAYNAGPSRYTAYLVQGRPLPAETVDYVAAVSGVSAPRHIPSPLFVPDAGNHAVATGRLVQSTVFAIAPRRQVLERQEDVRSGVVGPVGGTP